MRITNYYDLPAAILDAVADQRQPTPGTFYVTDLINSPCQRILTMRHWDDLEDDVSDRLWLLLGKAVHAVLERHAPETALAEQEVTAELDGATIIGHADIYHDKSVEDYKTVSVYSFLLGEKQEWVNQLNVYGWLFRSQGLPVENLRIRAILRDWMKSKALRENDYPPIPFMSLEIPLWDMEKAEAYVRRRLELHMAAERNGSVPPPCTDEEKWARPPAYAVVRPKTTRAVRVLPTYDEAVAWAEANMRLPYTIEERKSESVRCRDYCRVRAVCPHNEYR